MDVLIKGARVVDCAQDFTGDVYIRGGIIEEIGRSLTKECNVINADGLTLLPAFIDLHSHFRDPGLTYKEDILSGSLAAVKGGYTAVNLMANTKPVCSSMDIVDYVKGKAEKLGLIDIHQTVSITKDFDGCDISHLDSITDEVRFISDDGKGVLRDDVMLNAMKKAASTNITIICHEENPDITPIDTRLSENMMTARDIALSKYTNCHLHVAHVSTKEAMADIIAAKKNGINVTCEVTPHHLALNESTAYKVNPPLRPKEDVDFLISSLKQGWVDTISTDHAPHSIEDKMAGAPGISGLETAFSVCYTKLVDEGHITLSKLSELMSKNPAGMMGLKKGEIKIGFDGDLVLVDLGRKCKASPDSFASKGKNTPFLGMEFTGSVVITFKGGRIVYREDSADDN